MSEQTPIAESTVFTAAAEGAQPPIPPVPPGGGEEPRDRRKLIIILIVVFAVLLALLLGAFAWYLATKKPLSQIPVFSQATPPSFSTAFYDVKQPLGVALDEANNRIYVTQGGGDRTVVVFDMDGNKIGSLPQAKGIKGIQIPVYVAVDPTTSEVYVSDRFTGSIHVYDVQGNYVREFKPQGITSWAPLALAFDPDGNLYATDVTDGKQRVLEIAKDGKVLRTLGEKDGLAFPNGVAVLPDSSIAVADSNNGRVLVYSTKDSLSGALARGEADSSLGLPRGMSVDDRGRLYVVDTSGQNVRVYTPGDDKSAGLPAFSFTFGDEGQGNGMFEYPNGIALDNEGRIYVTDRENGRVQVWSY
jgi:DNA-binding beta-propeller fold protein YncE